MYFRTKIPRAWQQAFKNCKSPLPVSGSKKTESVSRSQIQKGPHAVASLRGPQGRAVQTPDPVLILYKIKYALMHLHVCAVALLRSRPIALSRSRALALRRLRRLMLSRSRTVEHKRSGALELWHSGALALWHSGALALSRSRTLS